MDINSGERWKARGADGGQIFFLLGFSECGYPVDKIVATAMLETPWVLLSPSDMSFVMPVPHQGIQFHSPLLML